MRITFTVDQKAAIRAGVNDHGTREREIDVSQLSPEDREVLAGALDVYGKVSTLAAADGVVPVTAEGPTAADLIAAIRRARAECDRIAAERRAKEDAELAETEAEDAEVLAARRLWGSRGRWEPDTGTRPNSWLLNYAKHRADELVTRNSPAWAAWLKEIAARNAAEQAEDAATRERDAAEKAAAAAAGKAALAAWVTAHGGELARVRLAEGYKCWVTAAHADYADHVHAAVAGHLDDAAEPEGTDGSPVVEPRKCPTVPEIAALRDMRRRIEGQPAEVALVYVRYDRADDCADDDTPKKQYRTELEVTVTCPDGATYTRYYLIPATTPLTDDNGVPL